MRGDQGSGPYAPGRSLAAVWVAHPLPTGMGHLTERTIKHGGRV